MGMTEAEREFAASLQRLIGAAGERADYLRSVHADLKQRGQLGRYAVHRYMCPRGDQLATVFRFGGRELCAVRDYKLSPGLNHERSVPAARERNTIDGDRHWPDHVYDLRELAEFGADAGMTVACRHVLTTIRARDMLQAIDGVRTGKPGRPTVVQGRDPQPTSAQPIH